MSGQREQVQDALYDWVEKALADKECPCPIIWTPFAGARPKPPFISLQMIGGERKGSPYKSGVDRETGQRTVRHEIKLTVSINAWGKNCMDRLEDISDSIDNSACIRLLRKNGLVVNRLEDVRESAEDVANGTETHGIFDIEVTFTRAVKEDIGWIDRLGAVTTDLPGNSEIHIEEQEEQNG